MAAEVEAGFERLDCVGALRMVPQPGRREGFSSGGHGGRRGLQRGVCGSALFPSPLGMVAAEIPCSLGRRFAGVQQHKTRWVLGQHSPQASRALGWLCEARGVSTVGLGGAKCWEEGGRLCSVTLLWCCSADRYYITVKLCLKME